VGANGAFADFVSHIGAFHITERTMSRAQREMEKAVASGEVDERSKSHYLEAVRRYFGDFSREAREHLRDVDRRLEHINQVHFNLTAERGVAIKRIEATEAVLRDLDRIGKPQAP
jgi:hypothetical protein